MLIVFTEELVCITVCIVRMQDCAARHHRVCTASIDYAYTTERDASLYVAIANKY